MCGVFFFFKLSEVGVKYIACKEHGVKLYIRECVHMVMSRHDFTVLVVTYGNIKAVIEI